MVEGEMWFLLLSSLGERMKIGFGLRLLWFRGEIYLAGGKRGDDWSKRNIFVPESDSDFGSHLLALGI
jgi:hypothetical protein